MERTCSDRKRVDNPTRFYWPQRNYRCSFCKRKFNSAQALGGHMNVHRRDRAMLIQLPSCAFECPNLYTAKSHPNPTFSPSTSSSSSSSSSNHYPHHSFRFSSNSLISNGLTNKKNSGEVVEILKKKEVISLELELGCKDSREALDLELRLGCF